MNNDYEATTPTNEFATPIDRSSVMSNDDVISTLNKLIETCKDGQEGFRQAAEGTENSNLKSAFYTYSQQRAQFAGELQSLVRQLGGDPENSGSFSGALHRGWMDIKSVVTGQDDGAILNECERGEDAAKKAYKNALEENLPANIIQFVQNQYTAILEAHDNVKAWRDTANNTSSTTARTGY